MIAKIVDLSVTHRLLVCTFGIMLLFGGLYAFHLLDVAAYPDPAPPLVEVITQKPGWSAEEIERQITVPMEVELAGMPGLTDIRSISLFGLSSVKMYFDYGTDWYFGRQEVLNRLSMIDFPIDVRPEISPWWSLGEIYRYELTGKETSLTELKTLQDWVVSREFKRVPGVIDVTSFGGTTKEYHVEIDPGELISYRVDLPQVMEAIANSNENVGGNYLTLGAQNHNVRGLGLIDTLDDIEDVMVAEKDGTPVFVKNLGKVSIGHQIRLGKVGIQDRDDVVEGIVLIHRGQKAGEVLERVQRKVESLNTNRLPDGVQIKTFYDRSVLIQTTIRTVMHILINGMVLVFLVLLIFVGHFRTAMIVTLTAPMALLFTFTIMKLIDQSANLISLGAIDLGIIVDSTLIMVERIFYQLAHRPIHGLTIQASIHRSARDVGRPIFFATAIIVVAFIPMFTMTGVPGRIFAPMSLTYGLALGGALLMSFSLAPVLCSLLLTGPIQERETWVVRKVRMAYEIVLRWALDHALPVVMLMVVLILMALVLVPFIGGEFMPALEEGNLWVRATMPVDISFEEAGELVTDIRQVFQSVPEATGVLSQLGRPDDGTDPTSFFNAEFMVKLKPAHEWRPHLIDKDHLIEEIEETLGTIPGVRFNFSQVIQDNVQEAMSGVKAENVIKLFGSDLSALEAKAAEIEAVMADVPGVRDLGIFHVLGQPNLLIRVDRQACARYGVRVSDVNAVVQAAIGGQAVTQVFEGDRWFDVVVRFMPEFRRDKESIGRIQVSTPEGVRIPLKQLATISTKTGAFMIYRENNERYLTIKFSVRGRDLEGTVKDAQQRLADAVVLPDGYRIEWHGEYDQLQSEKERLTKVVPFSLLIIIFLVYAAVNSFRDAVLVLAAVPSALVGGVYALALTGTDFSISAAVGFISLFGVSTLGGLILIMGIRDLRAEGYDVPSAIWNGAMTRMRPILMAMLAAGLGLLPAAVATGIGTQAQQPLARVVVGGMLSSAILILVVLPVLYQLMYSRETVQEPHDEISPVS
jgi:heavy metal efflux system protein